MLYLRKTRIDELELVLDIFKAARDYMIACGNPDQWGNSYPTEEIIRGDIESNICYMICDSSDDEGHGVFTLCEGADPSYEHIEDGEWLNDSEYITVHRLAGDGKLRGLFKFVIDYCKGVSGNIRLDTHEKNSVMLKLIAEQGFKRCGTIFVGDGTPRTAYQWTASEPEKIS